MAAALIRKVQELLTLHKNNGKYRIRNDYRRVLEELEILANEITAPKDPPAQLDQQAQKGTPTVSNKRTSYAEALNRPAPVSEHSTPIQKSPCHPVENARTRATERPSPLRQKSPPRGHTRQLADPTYPKEAQRVNQREGHQTPHATPKEL